MTRWNTTRAVWGPFFLASLGLPLAGCADEPDPALVIAATFSAKETCSDLFVGGLDEVRIAEDLERFSALGLVSEVDTAGRRVTVRSADGSAQGAAIHRTGTGCVILNADSSRVFDHARRMAELEWSQPAADREGAGVAIGTALGYAPQESVDLDRIRAVVDDAFLEPNPDEPRRTRAVVVVHDGRLVHERYAPGIGPGNRLRGWSMAKSVTAALVGILIEDGRLDLLRPLPVPEWTAPDDPRRRITLIDMLEMASGLEFDESYDGGATDPAVMLFAASDAGAFAAGKPLAEPPGSAYRYSSGTTNIISRSIRSVIGDDEWYWRFPQTALFEPIGARGVVLETDPSGTFVGSSFAWATPRDWARLGQLFLQNGVWDGRRVLPDGWSGYVSAPTPTDPRAGFGAHFATNAGGRWPTVPSDVYLMSGLDGQYVFIAPSRRAVVVRLGQTPGEGFEAEEFIGGVLSALPEVPGLEPSSGPPRADTLRVLLVGSSYLFLNNLGDVLDGIADGLPAGPAIESRLAVRGAARLAWHVAEGTVERSFEQRPADVVVLQEQSRLLPLVELMAPEQIADTGQSLGTPEHFHAAVRELAPVIRGAGARPVLFQTWARRHKPEQTAVLEEAYESIGAELGIDVAPVGRAWATARERLPDQNLYWFDPSHPSPSGSYLAALVVYATVTGRNPLNAPSRVVGHPTRRDGTVDEARLQVLVDLPPMIATVLQQIAWDVVSARSR